MNLTEIFKNPPAEYRIKPFWFWNGDMTKEEIRHQIEEMADKGLGGMFICARQGMTLPYLSKEWFDMTVYACDLAKEYGLEAWLYDEYPYPSGMSGGEVLLAEHSVLHHKSFLAEGEKELEADLGWTRILFAKAFPVKENETDWENGLDLKDMIGNLQTEKIYQKTGLTRYNNKRFFSYGPRKILKAVLPEGKWNIEIYTEGTLGDFKYYGGFFDPCNEKAVQTFIETTHERYRKALGERFGISVHGMFSDEVGLLSPIPWSRSLPEKFKERNGYDILSHLPALHHREIKDSARIRYDLYDTAHEMFRESYHKQVSDWCKKNHLLYATEVPSMRLGTEKYSDIIGGDTAHEKLGKSLEWIYDEYIRNYRSNAKAVSSLARQLGKKYAMIESFHSVGWSMTLQDAKWMIDRLGCSGINLYNFHAFYYTIQDITKHDAPPSQFLQNPYWKHYKKLADYVGRMGAIVTNTEADISIAVLDPAAALWTKLANPFQGFPYKGESETEKAECDLIRDQWVSICKTLLFEQLDYDHLDAEILMGATVEDGKIKIGKAEYSVVILPPCDCMESAAREKLEQFVLRGGCLIGISTIPHEIIDEDQKTAEHWRKLFEMPGSHFLKEEKWEKPMIELCRIYCEDFAKRRVASGNKKNVISCTRKDEKGNLFVFSVNQGNGQVLVSAEVNSSFIGGNAEEWNLENGTVTPVPFHDDKLAVSLGPYESRWIKVLKKSNGTIQKEKEPAFVNMPVVHIPFTGLKKLKLEGKNICRFDEVGMSLDGKTWIKTETETFIEQCQETGILDGRRLKFSGSFGTPKKVEAAYPLTCYYRAQFEVQQMPKDIFLLMDKETAAGPSVVSVNGKVLPEERWKEVFVNDQNNRAAFVDDMIIMGKNTITFQITVEKDEDGLRDNFYLWGNFGVNPGKDCPVIGEMPEKAEFSHKWINGIPYYSGTISLEDKADFPQISEDEFYLELDLPKPVYDCMEVLINGHSLGVKAYTPYRWNCRKEFLENEENRVEVKVTNTLANMLDGDYFDYESHSLIKIAEKGD